MDFLDRSENERNRVLEQAEKERKQKLRYAWSIAIVLAVMLAASLILGWIASREQKRAETNLQLAKRAVDEMLSSAGDNFARVAADVPPMEEFRRQLLQKAKDFYAQFTQQKPNREEFRAEMALAFFKLGDIQSVRADDPTGTASAIAGKRGLPAGTGSNPLQPRHITHGAGGPFRRVRFSRGDSPVTPAGAKHCTSEQC
jgi:hypothetical protein